MHIIIIKYTSHYKKALLDLLKYMWKGLDKDKIKERFEWRYEQNPYKLDPCVYLAVDGSMVVGCRCFVVQLFQLKEKNYYIFIPADLIVHPDYRRKGIFSRVNSASLEDIHNSFRGNSIILNLSANKLSTLGNIKNGWQKMNCLKKFSCKISIYNYFQNKLIRRPPGKKNLPVTISQNGYEIEITFELKGKDVSNFIKIKRDRYKFTNIRDVSFFEWRYSYQPDKYTYVYCYTGSTMKGYLIIKKVSDVQYFLEEFSAIDPNVLGLMINNVIEKLCIGFMRTWELYTDDKVWFGKCGFISEPEKILKLFGKERLPILVQTTSLELTDEDYIVEGLDIRNINNWHIQLSDMH